MDDRSARAAARRCTWSGGVAKDSVEMEDVSLEWWLSMTPEERIGCVFDMWEEQMQLLDPSYRAPHRLDRSIGGVRPLRD